MQINDTSNSPITYNLVATAGTVNEGQSFDVDLVVENGISGVTLSYTVTGISPNRFILTGTISGNYVTGTTTRQSFTIAEDFTTEGTETFVISLTTIDGITASVTINDTSTILVAGDEIITTPGSGSFTIPTGVTSISVMAVGGGAGTGTTSALGAGTSPGGGGAGALGILTI